MEQICACHLCFYGLRFVGGLIDCGLFSTSVTVLGMDHVRLCIAQSIHAQHRTWR